MRCGCFGIGIVIALTTTSALAQQACTASEFRAFDFWLGTWEVTNQTTGKPAGINHIALAEHGCALVERWQGAEGGTGQSVNFYNPLTGVWRQIWVSAGAGGYSIDISGAIDEAGAMTLKGEISYYAHGLAAPFRGTWTPNPDGTVRQFLEQFDSDAERWAIWFDGLYRPSSTR